MDKTNRVELRALGELISGVAHEINTPMHSIGINLEFLQIAFRDLLALDAKYKQMLAKVRAGVVLTSADWSALDEAEKEAEPQYLKDETSQALGQSLEGFGLVSRLVLALKDFSHPPTNDFALTDVNKCIDTVCTISRHEWKRNAEIKLDLARDLPYLFGSSDELHQVLINLVVNAAHAIKEKIAAGGYDRGQICITTRYCFKKIEIEVKDDGPGISSQLQELIFQPHFTTKEAGKGTGMGLSLVKRIVEEGHGGKVTVVSDGKTGTSFILVLPDRQNSAEL